MTGSVSFWSWDVQTGYWPATFRKRLPEVCLCFRFPVAALPLFERFVKLLLLSQVRKTTWLREILLWTSPPASCLESPLLLPPKKLVLCFILRFAFKASDRLPPLSMNPPPKLPELFCRLSWEPESIDVNELREEDTLRFRIRPFWLTARRN